MACWAAALWGHRAGHPHHPCFDGSRMARHCQRKTTEGLLGGLSRQVITDKEASGNSALQFRIFQSDDAHDREPKSCGMR